MAVGYGYVRSEEPTIVDWGAITKQATDSLAALDADRKKRRADIEETSREYYKELANKPVSQNTAFNTFMSDYSSQASKAMLAITNQLKTGEISEEEFYRKRGNISSQTQIMLSNFKTYAENYDKAIQRAGAGGLGSAQEAYEKGLGQQFTNFENLRPIIDPNSYEVMFARESVGLDGKSKVEMASANDVFQFSNFTRDKFNLDGAIEARLKNIGITSYKNQFGEVVTGQYIGKGGEVLTDAIKKDARGIVSQDETVISILTDYGVETTYDFAMLPDDVNNTISVTERENKIKKLQEQNPDLIYRDSNGKYYVSDSQRESAAIFVEEQLTNAASYKKEEAPYKQKEIIQARLKLTNAQAQRLIDTATKEGEPTETTNDILADIITEKFTFAPNATVEDSTEQIKRNLEDLGFSGVDVVEGKVTFPNPTDSDAPPITINLGGRAPAEWTELFKTRLPGIPGYGKLLLAQAAASRAGGVGATDTSKYNQ